MIKRFCEISKEEFIVSDLEIKLRKSLKISDLPKKSPWIRFRELGAFWQHWNLHKRRCEKTNKEIISVFSEKCIYPVWQKDMWIKHSDPPKAYFDFSRDFFSQAWELFQKCPIPHTFQSFNENCEYTDDWYHSKNCYLCHSGQDNEDLRYCYGCDKSKNLHFAECAFNSELGIDIINSHKCFDSKYILYSWNISSSSFLYDCRNCSDCMFCFNLRNKKYCFGNKQLSKEAFHKKKEQWNLKSREIYDKAKSFFEDMMLNLAWHKFQDIEHEEKSYGGYVSHVKNCENCFLLSEHEDCVNVAFCGPKARNILDSIGTVGAELTYYCSLPVYSYEARFCFSINHCRFIDYSAHCFQCENCFGCCGLVGKKYHIFNKQYSPKEYFKTREKIIKHMKESDEWGIFFPGHFAPNPYDESWAGYHFPLSKKEQQDLGFRTSETKERKNKSYIPSSEVPDSLEKVNPEEEKLLLDKIFWDETFGKPFQISAADINFSRDLDCPLPNSYYISRIQENFSWMPFNGKLRDCNCGKCQRSIQTNWPLKYDGRVLCGECYLDSLI